MEIKVKGREVFVDGEFYGHITGSVRYDVGTGKLGGYGLRKGGHYPEGEKVCEPVYLHRRDLVRELPHIIGTHEGLEL